MQRVKPRNGMHIEEIMASKRCEALYSWASLSCCTSLNRRGLLIDPVVSFASCPCWAKRFLMKREMRICGRFCHSFITSFGAITWNGEESLVNHATVMDDVVLTWSPLRRFSSATQTMAALMPAWWVSAAKIVAGREAKIQLRCLAFVTASLTFHLNIHDAKLAQLLQVVHLVLLSEFAESSVETTLAFIEVIRAHGLARDGLVGILRWVGEALQLARQFLVELRRSVDDFSENCL